MRRRIDRALNKASGQLWIDQETFEAARIELELIDKVRLWWGVVGSISHARGSLDRGPAPGHALATVALSDLKAGFLVGAVSDQDKTFGNANGLTIE